MSGSATNSPRFELDHLVVAARTLDEGVAWCEATFGVAPAAGGAHAFMGTHNRLLALGSERFPRSYLEIIAVDPDAAVPPRRRWFDLDTAAMQRAIAARPQLVHWVARTDAIESGAAFLRATGHDPGTVAAAERMTPRGLLRWRITLRDDGARPAHGAAPLLIEWGDEHPCDALPASGLALESFELRGVPPAFAARLGVEGAAAASRAPAIAATLSTRLGRVELCSPLPGFA